MDALRAPIEAHSSWIRSRLPGFCSAEVHKRDRDGLLTATATIVMAFSRRCPVWVLGNRHGHVQVRNDLRQVPSDLVHHILLAACSFLLQGTEAEYSSGPDKLYDQAKATPERATPAILSSAWQNLLQNRYCLTECSDPSRRATQLHALHWKAGCESRPEELLLRLLLKAGVWHRCPDYKNDHFPL